jgi:site-specific DNA recombinase
VSTLKLVESSSAALRAAIYLRVSSGKQAEREISIPDQRRQILKECDRRGWVVVYEASDSKTGTNDNRAEFQRLIDRATDGSQPFDVIVVHSFSRFFRDEDRTRASRSNAAKARGQARQHNAGSS